MTSEAYGMSTQEASTTNSIKANPNEAYAMSITTEKNEAYKPVVNVSEACDKYDYI